MKHTDPYMNCAKCVGAFYKKDAPTGSEGLGSEGLTFCLLIFRAAWVWEKYPIVRPFKWEKLNNWPIKHQILEWPILTNVSPAQLVSVLDLVHGAVCRESLHLNQDIPCLFSSPNFAHIAESCLYYFKAVPFPKLLFGPFPQGQVHIFSLCFAVLLLNTQLQQGEEHWSCCWNSLVHVKVCRCACGLSKRLSQHMAKFSL